MLPALFVCRTFSAQARDLTFEDRVQAQETIERDPCLLEARPNTWGVLRTIGPFLRAVRRYRPPLQGEDLDLIRAGQGDHAASRLDPARLTLGWERYAAGRIRVHPLAGKHFTILDSAHVDELAECISAILARRQPAVAMSAGADPKITGP